MSIQNPDIRIHSSEKFNTYLKSIRSNTLIMGWFIEMQLEDTINALLGEDEKLAKQVFKKDRMINRMQIEIDEKCCRIIALRQPAARDLRYIITVIKTVDALESMGNHIKQISKHVRRLVRRNVKKGTYDDLQYFYSEAQECIHDAISAFSESDINGAMKTITHSERLRKQLRNSIKQLVKQVKANNVQTATGIDLMWILKEVDRIQIQVNNICEDVIYSASGQDVRHSSLEAMKKVTKIRRYQDSG